MPDERPPSPARSRALSARTVLLEGGAQPADEDAFFRRLVLPNGTYKTTAHGRLGALDDLILPHLPASPRLRVLDAGASSGATSHDLLVRLSEAGRTIDLVVADLFVEARLQSLLPGLELLRLPDGFVLQIDAGGFALHRPDPLAMTVRSRVGRALFRLVERTTAGRLGTRLPILPVQLVASRLRREASVHIVEQDLQVPRKDWRGSFDVVRAANILNQAYFDREALGTMVGNLWSYLRPGGLLLVSRTTDGLEHRGSLFRRNGQAREVLVRIGGGSEIEELILDTPTPASDLSSP